MPGSAIAAKPEARERGARSTAALGLLDGAGSTAERTEARPPLVRARDPPAVITTFGPHRAAQQSRRRIDQAAIRPTLRPWCSTGVISREARSTHARMTRLLPSCSQISRPVESSKLASAGEALVRHR